MHSCKQQQEVVEDPGTFESSADTPPWVPTLLSTSAAVFAVWLVHPIRDEAILASVGSLFGPLLAVVLAGSVAGIAALLAFRWFYPNLDRQSWLWAIACCGNGMLLVPLAHLAELQSPLAVIWAAFVGYSVARFVRAVPAADAPEPLRPTEGGMLFASVADTEPSLGALFAFGATIAMKAALVTQVSGWAIPSVLLAGASCFIIGMLAAGPTHRHDGSHRKRTWLGFVTKGLAAVAVTMLLLVRIPVAMPNGPLEARYSQRGRARSSRVPSQPNLLSGAILLADASTTQRLVAPNPNRKPSLLKRRTASTRIPFAGEYWIRSRTTRQRPRDVMEHHASPLGYSFDTVDGSPIHMQAHQRFSTPIEIGDAGVIEIGIHNQDPQPETIGLKLSIRDTNTQTRRWLDLVQLRIPPKERATMRFPIPPDASIVAFDEILIEFLLYQPRVNRSAKVAVEWLAFGSASKGN